MQNLDVEVYENDYAAEVEFFGGEDVLEDMALDANEYYNSVDYENDLIDRAEAEAYQAELWADYYRDCM